MLKTRLEQEQGLIEAQSWKTIQAQEQALLTIAAQSLGIRQTEREVADFGLQIRQIRWKILQWSLEQEAREFAARIRRKRLLFVQERLELVVPQTLQTRHCRILLRQLELVVRIQQNPQAQEQEPEQLPQILQRRPRLEH